MAMKRTTLRDEDEREWRDDTFAAALVRTAREFEAADTPPGRIFSDPDLYRRELDDIFGRMWLCVGHRSRLRDTGDFFVVEFGRESLVVVLDEHRAPRAYLNVCRHRGTRIVNQANGNCSKFLCPYHAWHYGLDGTLKAAPGMEQQTGFRRNDYSLREAKVESFLGFLFVNLDREAEPLANAFDDFPDLDRYELPMLQRVARHEYLVDANWKLICENYHECYHCGIAHPQLARISHHADLDNHGASGRRFIGGPMAVKPGFESLTMSGRRVAEPFSRLPADEHNVIHYFNLLPNFLLSIAPDYVLTHHLWPRGPEQVFIETEWFASPEQLTDDYAIDDAEAFWDRTNRQDWTLCETAQKGLSSSHHLPGRYHPSEDCAHRFDRWYVRHMFPGLCGDDAGEGQ